MKNEILSFKKNYNKNILIMLEILKYLEKYKYFIEEDFGLFLGDSIQIQIGRAHV